MKNFVLWIWQADTFVAKMVLINLAFTAGWLFALFV